MKTGSCLFAAIIALSLDAGPVFAASATWLANPRNSDWNEPDQWKEIDGSSTGLQDKLVDSGFMPLPYLTEQYLNESALWPTLRTGPYTAILKDAGNASGIGLIEFYEY